MELQLSSSDKMLQNAGKFYWHVSCSGFPCTLKKFLACYMFLIGEISQTLIGNNILKRFLLI